MLDYLRRIATRSGIITAGEWSKFKVSVVAGIAVATMLGVFQVIESGVRIFSSSVVTSSCVLPKAQPGSSMSVLVAKLDSDADGSQTRHVVNSITQELDDRLKFQIAVTPCPLEIKLSGDITINQIEAESKGRSWLRESGFEILVFGYVAAKDDVLHLYFLNGEAISCGCGSEKIQSASRRYELTRKLELPTDFGNDLGTAIVVSVLTQQVKYIGELGLLNPNSKQIDRLVNAYQRVDSITDAQIRAPKQALCGLNYAKAQFTFSVGQYTNNRKMMENGVQKAEQVFKDKECKFNQEVLFRVIWAGETLTLAKFTNDRNTFDKAFKLLESTLDSVKAATASPYSVIFIKTTLAEAYRSYGLSFDDLSSIAKSVELAEAQLVAIKRLESSQQSGSVDAILVQTLIKPNVYLEIGSSIIEYGWKRRDAKYLKRGIKILEAAIQDIDQVENVSRTHSSKFASSILGISSPQEILARQFRALLQDKLAISVRTLGRLLNDVNVLQSSISLFEKVASDWTNLKMPYEAADAKNQIAYSKKLIGEQVGSKDMLEAAIRDFEVVQKTWSKELYPTDWAFVERNKARIIFHIGFLDSDQDKFSEALRLFDKVVAILDREAWPLEWATTQIERGSTLRNWGQKKNDIGKLREAIAAFRDATEARSTNKAPKIDIAMARANRLVAEQYVANLERDEDGQLSVIHAMENIVKIVDRERYPESWGWIQINRCNGLTFYGTTYGAKWIEEAVDTCKSSFDAYLAVAGNSDRIWAFQSLAFAKGELGGFRGDPKLLQEGAELIRQVISEKGASISVITKNYLSYLLGSYHLRAALHFSDSRLWLAVREVKVSANSADEVYRPYYNFLIGLGLRELGKRSNQVNLLEESINVLSTARGAVNAERRPYFDWLYASALLALVEHAGVASKLDTLNTAIVILRDGISKLQRNKQPTWWAFYKKYLAQGLRLRAVATADPSFLKQAHAEARQALILFDEIGSPYETKLVKDEIEKIDAALRMDRLK